MITPEIQELISSLIDKVNKLEKVVSDLVTQEGSPGSYTDEDAQDAVGLILVDSATVDFTYTDTTPSITADVKNDSITYAKMQNIATDSLIGRDTASSGDPENILLNATLEMDGSGNLRRAALTGDVTASAGSNATSIANDAVTNAKAANMAADTIKGRANGAGTGDPTDLTPTQVRTIINVENGADVTDAGNIASSITGVSTDDTIADADVWGYLTGGALVKTVWSNIKAVLKTYFDTLYGLLAGNNTWSGTNKFDATVTLSPGGTQDYSLGDDGANALTLNALGAGKDFDWRLHTQDADGTDNVLFTLYAVGKPGNYTNYERGRLIYAAASQEFRFDTGAAGSGTVRPLVLLTQGNTNQIRLATDGSVGFGVASTAARIDVLQPTLGDAVQKLASTATNDDPTQLVYQNRVATTNNTVTTLHTFTIPASTTYAVEVSVVARRTGGVAGTAEDGAHYILRGVYQNVAGTATIIGAVVQTVVGESQAGWDATLDTTGATVRVRVTGATNNNITWHCTARIWAVGS